MSQKEFLMFLLGWVLDPSETEKIFGWKSKIEFKKIIKNQLVWYDKYGISNIYSHLKDK